MKKTMTRILTLALALAMSASVLAGCSDSPEPAASGSSTESTASEDAAGGERAKLTAMIVKWSPLTKDVNEMQWLKNVAEAANVEVEWQQESSDWNDKKNAVFQAAIFQMCFSQRLEMRSLLNILVCLRIWVL